jgi:hypothetical protein
MKKKAWAGLALVAGFALLSSASDANAETGINAGVRADIKTDIKADVRDLRGDIKDMRGELRDDMKERRDDLRRDISQKVDAAVADIGVVGTVTAKSGTTLTVVGTPFALRGTSTASTTYSVDASGAKVRTEDKKDDATLSDISVGDTVHAIGKIDGTSVAATAVIEGRVMFKADSRPQASSTWATSTDSGKRGVFSRIGHFFRGFFGGKADMKADARYESNN